MIIEEEVIKQGINWFALIIAIIFFLILTRPSVIKQVERLKESRISIYIISLLLSSAIYFLIDSVK
ncbi:hypothetical protein ACOTWR_06510 [Aliarcobacter butzleri]|uniref:hypothetical protein n=1 Tax=Aliarcobacter butzleri TaxID=28197 RepID=UPI0021B23DD2|nr:hypothetical protein [Aliarcobacter butzleri]MCT7578702.1 hypothetical protein [Aliarcobacter butzleri]MCT7647648.1 hypothetical protein [Aliarcobacter butzleri]